MYTFVTVPGIEKIVTGQIYPGVKTKVETLLEIPDYDVDHLISGKKTALVRHGYGKIVVPAGPSLPLIVTSAFGPDSVRGDLLVPRFTVKRFEEIWSEDVWAGGASGLTSLFEVINELGDGEKLDVDKLWMTIYEVRLPQ